MAVVRLGRGGPGDWGLGGGGLEPAEPSSSDPAPDAAAEPPDAMLMSSPGVSSLDVPAGVVGVGVRGP